MTTLRLNIARFLERSLSEGPGSRAVLWVQGCSILCPGCCNPGYLAKVDRQWVPVDQVVERILMLTDIEGVSFLGGEPFDQAEALGHIATQLQMHGLSVVTFTGYLIEDLQNRPDEGAQRLLASTDLLIDGPFIQAQFTTERHWVGSSNQRLHFLTARYADVETRLSTTQTNTIEIRVSENSIDVNGFAFPGLVEGLRNQLAEKGITWSKRSSEL